MKTILLMRHAKSSWKDPNLEDSQRPLNKRGFKDAPRIGRLLKDKELVPQRILCSTAQRARQTVEGVVEKSGYKGDVFYTDSLYLAEPSAILDAFRSLPDDLERVMVVGHNPGLEGVLQMLSGRVEPLPTAALAYLVLPVNRWGDLTEETQGDLIEIWRGHDLK